MKQLRKSQEKPRRSLEKTWEDPTEPPVAKPGGLHFLESWKYWGGPFVPVPKKWLLAYQPEERKRRSMSDLVGKLYELDRLEFSFPLAGVSRQHKEAKIKTKTREEKLSFSGT